ncbi:MAG: hypothetical protein ABF735_10900, partial [Lentilactobacillus hilgardii]
RQPSLKFMSLDHCIMAMWTWVPSFANWAFNFTICPVMLASENHFILIKIVGIKTCVSFWTDWK